MAKRTCDTCPFALTCLSGVVQTWWCRRCGRAVMAHRMPGGGDYLWYTYPNCAKACCQTFLRARDDCVNCNHAKYPPGKTWEQLL